MVTRCGATIQIDVSYTLWPGFNNVVRPNKDHVDHKTADIDEKPSNFNPV